MIRALFAREIAQQIAARVGIRAELIEVYPAGDGWDASLRADAGIWSSANNAAVKQTAKAFKSIYSLKKG
jgi:hypothetical protein